MNKNNLILLIGILGIVFCGYFLLTGKDTSTSLIGFICGASLLFLWVQTRKKIEK